MDNDDGFYIVYQSIMDILRLTEDTNGDCISTTSIPNCVSYNHTGAQSQLLLGKSLMCPTGSWFYSEMSASIEDDSNWGFMPVPYLSDAEGNPITKEGVEMPKNEDGSYTNYTRINELDYFCIPTRAKNQEEAKAFLKFMLSEEYMPNLQEDTQSIMAYEFDNSEVEKSAWLKTVEETVEDAVLADTFTGSKMQIFGYIQLYYNPYGVRPYALLSQGGYGSFQRLIDTATGKEISSADQAAGVAVTENVYNYVKGNYNGRLSTWSEAVRKVDGF